MEIYTRRRSLPGGYEILPAAEFPAGCSVELPIKVQDNNWVLEGAFALKQLPAINYSKIITDYKTGTGQVIARTGFSTGIANGRQIVCYCHTSNAGGYTWMYPATLGTKVIFTLQYGSVILNGTTYTLRSGTPNPNTNEYLRINDERAGALNMIFYNLKATHNSVVAGNYVVARKICDDVIGILDRATGTFIKPTGGTLKPLTLVGGVNT